MKRSNASKNCTKVKKPREESADYERDESEQEVSEPGSSSDDLLGDIQMFRLEECETLRIGEDRDGSSSVGSSQASTSTSSGSPLLASSKWQTSAATPLERQVAELKRKHPNVVMFVECGYRYRFFGEDAEVM